MLDLVLKSGKMPSAARDHVRNAKWAARFYCVDAAQFARARGKCMAIGTVKWFNATKGYGFITPTDGGDDVFAHYSAIEMEGYKTLKEGQKVEYDVQDGPKGPQASHIRAVPR